MVHELDDREIEIVRGREHIRYEMVSISACDRQYDDITEDDRR